MPASTTKTPEAIPAEDPDGGHIIFSNPRGMLDQRREGQPMHRDDEGVSSLHPSEIEAGNREGEGMHWHRPPSPDLPMDWDRRPSPNVAMGEGWRRQRTPELPIGENYYAVDTSYHGGRKSPYDPPQPSQHQSSSRSGGRSSSPRYDTYLPIKSKFIEGLKPQPAPTLRPSQSLATDSFRDYLELSHEGSGRLDFPDADYGRLNH